MRGRMRPLALLIAALVVGGIALATASAFPVAIALQIVLVTTGAAITTAVILWTVVGGRLDRIAAD